ncbi:amidohydrolase family protein [Kyrpidia spormannii]|uniref:Amidohydrolase 2 n=2 Tax=Kyrpidia spormannii TaxID=2055160 RepID=A0ACA8ZAY1_9BACL|nr:amidohydrolase family protein [Kyrpidia spormannii]CAB3393481.1 Amidohydrolase 2 [Kyrpidia spormannii]CAB3394403.1 Amidohydrolase 2 [Kyrpidia spormannii]
MERLLPRIIDIHAHFPAAPKPGQAMERDIHPLVKKYNEKLRAEWRQRFGFDDPETSHPGNEVQADRWATELDKYNISKIIFVTGGGNDTLASVVRRHPDKFIGFVHVRLEQEDAYDEIVRGIEELGLSGLKLFGPLMTKPFEAPEFTRIWTFLADRRLPVLIHFGILGGPGGIVHHPYISPLTLAKVAQTYTDIPFIIPHFGAGYWQELLHLCWSAPNIYVDGSGSNDWIRWMPYSLTLRDLFAKAYETIGAERIVFGSDSSWFPRGFAYRYLVDQVNVCREIGMTENEMDRVFYRNAAQLLGLAGEQGHRE